MKAATLHCPDCGAPASPGARECRYCHARLATVKCPACFAAAFVGMRHCPACGTALMREDAPGEGALGCPCCPGALLPIRLGPNLLRECDGCGGLWVDNRTFLAICRDRERQAALASGRRVGRPPPEPLEMRFRYHGCPVCGAMMDRINFAGTSGVIVDVCREHGTWFGFGELHRVVEFLGRRGAGWGDPALSIYTHFIPEGGFAPEGGG